jgi:hypothetical protein
MAINTNNDLRKFLADQIEKVSKGEVSPEAANATANLSRNLLQSCKLELDYAKMVNAIPRIDFIQVDSAEPKQITAEA